MAAGSEVQRSLRRWKSATKRRGIHNRQRSDLPFLVGANLPQALLLDTTVYIDVLQGRLPPAVELAIRAVNVWHSTVTECELAALAGLLDPERSDTQRAIEQVFASIEQRPSHRIVTPDREVWREAGILAGLLARFQHYGKAERTRALNDALILQSARKSGLTVLTRNVSDFDLLMQLVPGSKALFYMRE